MPALTPSLSFLVALVAAAAWFMGVMFLTGGQEPSPAAHAFILAFPIMFCGLLQYRLSRRGQLTTARRWIHAGATALLAPMLATALIWMIWVAGLRHGG